MKRLLGFIAVGIFGFYQSAMANCYCPQGVPYGNQCMAPAGANQQMVPIGSLVCGTPQRQSQNTAYSVLTYSSKTGKFVATSSYGAERQAVKYGKEQCKRHNDNQSCDKYDYKMSPNGMTAHLYVVMGENPKIAVGKKGRFVAFMDGVVRKPSDDGVKEYGRRLVYQCQNAGMINCQFVFWE
ncbi:MAG: hypothetical protein Q3971_03320 [Moraxella sp.]|nr:hypothetical protein [Moraxella sp.]